MKKLFVVLIVLFFSAPFFAESKNTFKLFTESTPAKTVIDYCLENNWKISLNKSKTSLNCEPTDTWYYYDYKIVNLAFSFTADGLIQTQTIVLGDPAFSFVDAYKSLMEIACKDKTIFLNVKYLDTDVSNPGIVYYTKTPDFNACLHMITGIDDNFCISILYGNDSSK